MAAVIKTIVIVCSLAAGCTACMNSMGETKKEEPTLQTYRNEIIQLAYMKANKAIADLNQKVGTCDDMGAKTVIPPQVFPVLPISDDEWRTALLYLSSRATDRCVGAAWGAAVLAFDQFKVIEKKLTGKNASDTLTSGNFQYNLEDLCCGALETQLRIELKYNKIDPAARQTLESIPELNKPFNPIATAKAMGR